jgi:non-ribosomal peptide synthetase component E (peptide arylation enzyme)
MVPPGSELVHVRTTATLVTPSATGQDRTAKWGDVQTTHSQRRAGVQQRGRGSGDTVLEEVPVLAVAVLVVFFALLTLADVLPGQSGTPGLVAPLR